MPPNVYAKFSVNSLMKMDPAERTSFYQAAQQGEWMTRNEIRALEDMNPVDGGDEFLHSVQWQESAPPDDDGTDEPTEPAPAGSPVKEPEE
jgi:phage portal protein BeeE